MDHPSAPATTGAPAVVGDLRVVTDLAVVTDLTVVTHPSPVTHPTDIPAAHDDDNWAPANRKAPRLGGLDLARAVAFLIMIIEHFHETVFAQSAVVPGLSSALTVLSGRGAAIFMLASGAGVTLLTRSGAPGMSAVLARRGLFLFAIGLALLTVWPTDILHVYGIFLLAAAVLHRRSTRLLATVGGVAALAIIPAAFLAPHLTAFNWHAGNPGAVAASLAASTFVTGQNPVFPWLGIFVLGMLVGRLRLTDEAVLRRLLWWAVATTIGASGAGLVLRSVARSRVDLMRDPGALLGLRYAPPGLMFILSITASAVAVLAACSLLSVRHRPTTWLAAAAALGRMPLTIYVVHIVPVILVIRALGIGHHGGSEAAVAWAVASFVLFCAGARTWFRRHTRGPIETAMRSLTG